jgi:D-Tyr-tRNAtyr deacylase
MRAVVQRVLSASVTGLFFSSIIYTDVVNFASVDSQTVSEISRGLMVLVGIGVGTSRSTYVLLQRENRMS